MTTDKLPRQHPVQRACEEIVRLQCFVEISAFAVTC
jgi:hypothetical protein